MSAKYRRLCLTIEVQGQPDCGYSIAFTSSLKEEFRDPGFRAWRQDVTEAIFKAGSRVFGAEQHEALADLLSDLSEINKRHAPKIKSLRGVPALQIQSVDGRKIEVQFSGKMDKTITVALSLKKFSAPRAINGHGSGGIRAAKKEDFPFIGEVRASAQAIEPPKKTLRPPGL